MPVLDTVVLFAAADPLDKFHEEGVRRLRSVGGKSLVATSALMEFDMVLKSRGLSSSERMKLMSLLRAEFPDVASSVHPISLSTLYLAALHEREFGLDYFDALIAAEAAEHDGEMVSSDRAFDTVPNLKRVRLEG
jgi:predicted nucleic acid-binding protein